LSSGEWSENKPRGAYKHTSDKSLEAAHNELHHGAQYGTCWEHSVGKRKPTAYDSPMKASRTSLAVAVTLALGTAIAFAPGCGTDETASSYVETKSGRWRLEQ
jgi:hypothetical protein